MRRSLLILVLCFGFVASHAQNRAVNRATNYLKSDKLAEAKEQIDMAVEHEKTKDKSKTWYTKGQIYSEIANAEDEALRNLDDNAYQEALEAYKKTMELEEKDDSPNSMLAEQGIDNLWRIKVNEGANKYESGDYEESLAAFQNALDAKPTDTLATFYAGVAAQNAGDIDEAITYFYKYEEIGNADEQIYNMLITYEMSKENEEKAQEVIAKAKEKFPDNIDFTKHEYQILLKQGKTDEAIKGLEAAVRAEPDNPDLYYNMGALNEEIKKKDEAIEAYKKALEIDPNHLNSAYNLAVIYYNGAADYIREANELGISAADQKKSKELMAKASEEFKEALPYIENAQSLHPEDPNLMQILMIAYDRTGQHKKADELDKKLSSLAEEE